MDRQSPGIDWQPVLVAAGASRRYGEGDKLLELLAGIPVVIRSLQALLAVPSRHPAIAVVSDATGALLERWAREGGRGDLVLVAGGERRRDSVEAGLRAAAAEYVAVHDAARPLATPALVRRVLAAAAGEPGAVPGTPVSDTIAAVDGAGRVVEHPPRERLRALQTPQVVRRLDWLRAASLDPSDVGDESAMLSRLGLRCTVVAGERRNLKLTAREDLSLLEALVQEISRCSE